jgi:hypothetical protein
MACQYDDAKQSEVSPMELACGSSTFTMKARPLRRQSTQACDSSTFTAATYNAMVAGREYDEPRHLLGINEHEVGQIDVGRLY